MASWALAAWLTCAPGRSQDPAGRRVVPADVGHAILHWVDAFDRGDLRIDAQQNVVANSSVDYVRLGVRGGAFEVGPDAEVLSHFGLLQHLVALAEKHPTTETARGLLALAATGFAEDMFDHQIAMVRDLGHFALLRIDAPTVWSHVHSVAVTEPAVGEDGVEVAVPRAADPDLPEFDANARAMWRVAAVRLLGVKKHGVFRSSIEKCLTHRDERVRLAAAEALGFLHRRQSLPVVTRVLSGEAHPMVAFALIEAMHRILSKRGEGVEDDRYGLAVRTALGRLGQAGWRCDMAIVRLVQHHPIAEAVQPMIALMRNARGESDPILKIINADASRLLSADAHRALRRITGAAFIEDPDVWQRFWDSEKNRVVVRRRIKPTAGRTVSTMRRKPAGFYGIPVLGSNVVFVLDKSGSMKAKVKSEYRSTSPQTGRDRVKKLHGSRLQIARFQTLKAVQSMPDNAKFSIVTFDSIVRVWNRKPVRARGARSTASRILSRLSPTGGTNVFDALVQVLDAKKSGYGEVSESNVDEIFVLSDGSPTSGTLTDPEMILAAVARINRVRRARINTVFAGRGGGAEFMRRLAEENGGVFVQQ